MVCGHRLGLAISFPRREILKGLYTFATNYYCFTASRITKQATLQVVLIYILVFSIYSIYAELYVSMDTDYKQALCSNCSHLLTNIQKVGEGTD